MTASYPVYSNVPLLWWNRVLIIWIIFLLTCLLAMGPSSGTLAAAHKSVVGPVSGLYDPVRDDVVVLTKDNLIQTVTNSKTIWLIQFYNSWCGHCINFAPTWKKLATDIKDWSCLIQIGAVDCSDTQNVHICRVYDVKVFPTIKLFFPHIENNNTGIYYDESQALIMLRNRLVDLASQYYRLTGHPWWKKMHPITSVDDIRKLKTEYNTVAAVIVESMNSHVGREVILDLCKYPKILVRRMLSSTASENYEVRDLLLVADGGQLRKVIKLNLTREVIVNTLKKLSGYNTSDTSFKGEQFQIETTITTTTTTIRPDLVNVKTTLKPRILSQTNQAVHAQDLVSGIYYMFNQEIAIRKDIQGNALSALQEFTRVLSQYFYAHSSVSKYLYNVNIWLSTVNYPMTGNTWVEKIDSLQTGDAFLPESVRWVGCQGSQPQFRGYPCSLWALFHYLTVSAYLNNKDDIKSNSTEVLNAISGYMRHFFGCDKCSQHFLNMAKTIPSQVHNHEDSVLWLWLAHNKVNKRLRNDISEDPNFPKLQFPPMEICRACHTRIRNGDNQQAETKNNFKWNKKEVLKFLVSFYSTNLVHDAESGHLPKDNPSAASRIQNVASVTAAILANVAMNMVNGRMPFVYATDVKPLDWWEVKQRKRDLDKLKDIKRQKRKQNQKRDLINQRLIIKEPRQSKVGPNRTMSPFWIFNKIDIGMCVIFYIFCLSLIIFLYFHFARRKSKRLCKLLPF